MIEAHTALTKLEPFSRCQDEHWLSVEEKKRTGMNAKSDLSIAEAVDRALRKDNVLRVTDYPEIDVQVRNGIVSLTGHVIGAMSLWRVENAIKDIHGLLGVRLNLVQDDQLIVEVAASLGWIEERFGEKFFTGAEHGVVVLGGTVGSVEVRDLAGHVAARNPKVRGIINRVHAPGIDLNLEDPFFVQPAIGAQIIFSDGRFGKVAQVIINPNSRRVVGMVLRGQFSDRLEKNDPQMIDYPRIPIQQVVIPVQAIQYLTQSSGFLSISSAEITQSQVFEPARYFVPIQGWVPPFPYCPADVLLTADYRVETGYAENNPDFIPLSAFGAMSTIREGAHV